MRISEKKQSELYSAIREPIMDARIAVKHVNNLTEDNVDDMLFKLEQRVWREVKKTLNIEAK